VCIGLARRASAIKPVQPPYSRLIKRVTCRNMPTLRSWESGSKEYVVSEPRRSRTVLTGTIRSPKLKKITHSSCSACAGAVLCELRARCEVRVQAAYSCTPLVPAGVQMGYRERRHPSFFDKARENTEVSKSKIHLVDSAAVEHT